MVHRPMLNLIHTSCSLSHSPGMPMMARFACLAGGGLTAGRSEGRLAGGWPPGGEPVARLPACLTWMVWSACSHQRLRSGHESQVMAFLSRAQKSASLTINTSDHGVLMASLRRSMRIRSMLCSREPAD